MQAHGSQAPPAAETLHTTDEHPFLTTDRGFVSAEDLRIGEQIRQLDGGYGVVLALQHIFGVAVRYNLTVQDDHTYAVGADQWVVHNTDGCGGSGNSNKGPGSAKPRWFKRLFRAVSTEERNNILEKGGRYTLRDGGVESKYFAETAEQAKAEGQAMYSKGFYLTSGKFPVDNLPDPVVVDQGIYPGGVTTYVIPGDDLSKFFDVTIGDFFQ